MAGTLNAEVEKRIKAIRKKLTQIDKLKAKGGQYTPEEAAKIESESKLLADIAALEKGEEPQEEMLSTLKGGGNKLESAELPGTADFANPEGSAELPPALDPEPQEELSPVEAEKRIRALKKKLVQIQKLAEKGGTYTKEEAEKIASQPAISAEVVKLEISLLDGEEKKTAFKLSQKLDQCIKLRAKGGQLNPQEHEKLANEASMKKQLDDILVARVPMKEDKPFKEEKPVERSVEKPAKKEVTASKVAPKSSALPLAPASIPAPVAVAEPVESFERSSYAFETEEYSAIAQAFAAEDNFEEHGFIECHRRHRKNRKAAEEEGAAAASAKETPETVSVEQAKLEITAQEAVTHEEKNAPAPGGSCVAEKVDPEPMNEVAPAAADRDVVADKKPPPTAQALQQHSAAPVDPMPREPEPTSEQAGPPSIEKRIRALKKKLVQIDKLKARGSREAHQVVEEKACPDREAQGEECRSEC